METKEVLEKAISWMSQRGWKRLTAKRHLFDQSLFDHTLVELDAMLQLLPILSRPNHFGLPEVEQQVLLVSVLAHDVGKERPEWQEYISGRRSFISDIDSALTSSIVPELCTALGFTTLSKQVLAVIENCVNLHMSRERSDTNVVLAMLQGADRWLTLANLVYHVDNVCSAKGVFEAQAALERSPLAKHLSTAYHQVAIRGVSTVLLHKAASDAFLESGWAPVLHYADATLYVASAAQRCQEPAPGLVQGHLIRLFAEATGHDVTRFTVGSPTANILPKPELFDHQEIGSYLQAAAKKIGRVGFTKKKTEDRQRVVEKYLKRKAVADFIFAQQDLTLHSERIGSAHPDMLVLKFFKAAMKMDAVGNGGRAIARAHYESLLGNGAWDELMSTATLMPAIDMVTVDRFWRLPGAHFGLSVAAVEELHAERRTQFLIESLTDIAEKVYSSVPNPPTRTALAGAMAAEFMKDLVHPVPPLNLAERAREQMQNYAGSKPTAGKQPKSAQHLCPICNMPFQDGTKASADFLDKPESHTNRGLAHGPFDYVTICDSCKYERILRQLLLGGRAEELIVIFPRMNVGPYAGNLLVRKARALYDRAYAVMTGDTDDPDRRVWLPLTHVIADQSLSRDLSQLTPADLADVLSFNSGEDQRRKTRQALEKALKEAYAGDLDAANVEWGTAFGTWDTAVDAVRRGAVHDPGALRIRAEVYRLQPQAQLVCQTPHMILMPIGYSIALGKDSDTNQALRRLFIALTLGIGLDSSVAVVRDSDSIDFQGDDGVAYVPAVASVRNLIGTNWVPVSHAQRWFRAIGLASILADAGEYSERIGLFEVLTAPTAGHVLRRIELKRTKEKRRLTGRDIAYLRAFQEVLA